MFKMKCPLLTWSKYIKEHFFQSSFLYPVGLKGCWNFKRKGLTVMMFGFIMLIIIIVVGILFFSLVKGGTFQSANLICGYLGIC